MQHSDEFTLLCDTLRKNIQEIDHTTLKNWLAEKKPLHLIDVREADEYAAGHIEGAVHLSKGWIEAKIHNQVKDKNDTIVVYCGGGNRSVFSADNLQKMGYANVYSLAGGYKIWQPG